MKKLDNHIDKAIENIKTDRALALTLLTSIMKDMSTTHDHKDLGQVAAKYLETLQRSNEQLVKVSALLHKKTSSSNSLTSVDKEEIYDLIEEDAANE